MVWFELPSSSLSTPPTRTSSDFPSSSSSASPSVASTSQPSAAKSLYPSYTALSNGPSQMPNVESSVISTPTMKPSAAMSVEPTRKSRQPSYLPTSTLRPVSPSSTPTLVPHLSPTSYPHSQYPSATQESAPPSPFPTSHSGISDQPTVNAETTKTQIVQVC